MTSELSPLALLFEEMKNPDLESRVTAMKRLRTVATLLGPERTRLDVIPFLSEHIDDDDEVLFVIASELGLFIDHVGGPEEAHILIEPLGNLAMVEETVVRQKAVESICSVIDVISSEVVTDYVVPVIQKLAANDWFTPKLSACGLICAAYSKISPSAADYRQALRKIFCSLCEDETPIVRRAAAKAIGPFALILEPEYIKEILPFFIALAGDDNDSVRLLAIENCTKLAKVFSPQDNTTLILPLVRACVGDKSWRVRSNVAKCFFELSSTLANVVSQDELLPLLVKLLSDPEGEVRAPAMKNIAPYVSLIPLQRFVEIFFPFLHQAQSDPYPHVRTGLVEAAAEIVSAHASNPAIAPVIKIYFQTLSDEVSEVRLESLVKLSPVISAVDDNLLKTQLVPALCRLLTDTLWRVREHVLRHLPILASKLGTADFTHLLFPYLRDALVDQVCAVRLAATKIMFSLSSTLGSHWSLQYLFPVLENIINDHKSPYLRRITVVYAAADLIRPQSPPEVLERALRVIETALGDSVANVRLVALQRYAEFSKKLPPLRGLETVVSRLRDDDDIDVKYAANIALLH